jgi:hypothetical protein
MKSVLIHRLSPISNGRSTNQIEGLCAFFGDLKAVNLAVIPAGIRHLRFLSLLSLQIVEWLKDRASVSPKEADPSSHERDIASAALRISETVTKAFENDDLTSSVSAYIDQEAIARLFALLAISRSHQISASNAIVIDIGAAAKDKLSVTLFNLLTTIDELTFDQRRLAYGMTTGLEALCHFPTRMPGVAPDIITGAYYLAASQISFAQKSIVVDRILPAVQLRDAEGRVTLMTILPADENGRSSLFEPNMIHGGVLESEDWYEKYFDAFANSLRALATTSPDLRIA